MTRQVTFLDPAEVQAKLADGTAYIVDVREPHEYAEAHIAGVAHMPLSQFDPSAISLPDGKMLIFQCRSGQRCGIASERLIEAGYQGEIYRMAGGLTAWISAGLPVESGASS